MKSHQKQWVEQGVMWTLLNLAIIASVFTFGQRTSQALAADGAGETSNLAISRPTASSALPTDRIIIKYKATTAASPYWMFNNPAGTEQMARLSSAAGALLFYLHQMSGGAHVLSLASRMPLEQVQGISERLNALPEVEYAHPDRILNHTLIPNDVEFGNQWHYYQTYGINAPAAWDITTGSSNIVVAVVDTGITNHADLSGRTVPGYDFIGDIQVANDGDGRDSSPSDPGDWITWIESVSEVSYFYGCPISNSSWHGTHVAGTIGAASDNGQGVAGINWNSKILPVRVLGKCGGYLSDVVDGMRWAAGLAVPGVPVNANPAKVINLSLGGYGACDTTMQTAINQITATGATVVVSAGNSNADASGEVPANCAGVITVAATDRLGSRAYYSNYGASVEISAPGGAQSFDNDPNGVLSTLNTGTTSPVADTYIYYQGTSMAAPHVSGVLSLMFSVDPNMTPGEALEILQTTARAFPEGSTCTPLLCGSGMVDAGGAVSAAQRPKPFGKNSPVNGAIGQLTHPTLSWATSSTANSYEYCYDTSNDNTCAGENWVDVGSSTSVELSGLSNITTYYWQVRAHNTAGETYANNNTWWAFTTEYPRPANDDFDYSEVIVTVPYTHTVNTTRATSASDDPVLPCAARTGYKSVWYQFTPPFDGVLNLDTFGSDFDTVLGVWTGSRGSLAATGCNDDREGFQSQLQIPVAAGQTYTVEVTDYTSSGGDLILNASLATLEAFDKSSPTDGATSQPTALKLSWDDSNGSTGYEVCYDTNDNSTCDESWVSVGISTSVEITGLVNSITYTWQVRAVSPTTTTYANEGTWWRFTTLPYLPPPPSFVEILSAGYYHNCGVKNDGTFPVAGPLTCWGENSVGQATPPQGTFTQVSAGSGHTCGLRNDGTLACWGGNYYGQATPPAGTFIQVSAGSVQSCGVKTDGKLICWGGEDWAPAETFIQVSAGGSHTCGLKSDGTLACKGANFYGEASPPGGTFTQVSAGLQHTCGLRSDATLACWGENNYGQSNPPAGTFTQVSAGFRNTCAVRSDSTLVCWGNNDYSQSSPPAGMFSLVATGGVGHTCALKINGDVICWGDYNNYQLDRKPEITEGDSLALIMSEDGSPIPFALILHAWDWNDTLTWSISTPAAHGTAIASGTGSTKAITYSPNMNYSGADSFTVRVSNDILLADSIVINLTIKPVNDPPVIVEGSSTSVVIDEDGTPTPFSLSLHAVDPDTEDIFTWRISTPASHGTASASGTGTPKEITYTPDANYNGTDNFVVQVSDDLGVTDDILVNITIQPVNDPPTLDKPGDLMINEDAVEQIVNLTGISDGDPELGQTLLVTATSSAPGVIPNPIVAYNSQFSTGTLRFTPVAEANGDITITVTVTDNGSNGLPNMNTVSQLFTVQVTPVNDPPAGTDQIVTTLEDIDYTFSAADFGFTDPNDNPVDNFNQVKITTLAGQGTLKLDGAVVSAGQSVSAIVITENKLVFTPTSNDHGTPYTSFTFQVEDDGGTANGGVNLDPAADTLTIHVTSVNDAPIILEGALVTVTMDEDSSPTPFNLTLHAADVDLGDTLIWSIHTPAAHGTASVNGAETSAAISYTPALDYNGSDSFIVQVSDGELTDGITVNVTIQSITDISGNAGVDGAMLTYTDGVTKTVTADIHGNYTFTVSHNYSGVVTPAKVGYTFTPPSRTYTNILADQIDQDYAAIPITFTISGNARVGGAILGYVDGTPKVVIADANGNYSFSVSYNWSGMVTPAKWGYIFTPSSHIYANVLADLADQDFTATPTPELSAGSLHTCGLQSGGKIATAGSAICWGAGSPGWPYGDPHYNQSIPPAGDFTQVSSGGTQTCAIQTDGSLICWGWNSFGQASPPAGSFTQLDSGGSHNCALKPDGTAACWGTNFYGESNPPPVTFLYVDVGINYSCGLKNNGSLVCWGRNDYGQSTPSNGPFIQINAGGFHACALKSDGSIACWGRNDDGQSIPPGGAFSQVSAGQHHSCGLRSDGSVICWGLNNYGQATPPSGTFSLISACGWHTCGVRSDGSVVCWGRNDYGQLDPRPEISEGDSFAQTMSEDGTPTPFDLTLNAWNLTNNPLTWCVSTPPAQGVAGASSVGTSKVITYTPNANYFGVDSFIVQVADGSAIDRITINVTVEPVNDAPLITEGDAISVTMDEDGAPTPFSLILNATDLENDLLTWSIPIAPVHGTSNVSGAGTSAAISYTPAIDYNGNDSLVVLVSDGDLTNGITVNVTIQSIPDISGNAGMEGATLTYTDGVTKTVTTDANGDYAFTVSYDWSGTVIPSKPGFTFTPPSRTYANVLVDQIDQDYTATPIVYTLSGNAGVDGATLTYADGVTKTVTADANGDYAFIVSYDWSGTVIPSKPGFTFTPPSRTYANVLVDQIDQDYTATPIVYTLSGNAGVEGATLGYTDGTMKTATADASGNYAFTVSYNWSGTVTPSKPGFTFTPPSRTYANVLADKTDQDYTATPIVYTLSGNAGVDGVTLTYTDGVTKTVTADANRDYALTVSYNWSGTVTPSKPGYTLTPTSRTYANVLADLTDQNYTAIPIVFTLSGNTGAGGATLSYTDGTPKTANADASGNYAFTVSYNWSGTVTPIKPGFTFTPASRTYTNVLADQTDQDYSVTPIVYTLSGNAGVGGATLSYTDGTPKTANADASGDYSFIVSYNWSGTVTPSKPGYTFTPVNRTYTNVLADQTDQDYTARNTKIYLPLVQR